MRIFVRLTDSTEFDCEFYGGASLTAVQTCLNSPDSTITLVGADHAHIIIPVRRISYVKVEYS